MRFVLPMSTVIECGCLWSAFQRVCQIVDESLSMARAIDSDSSTIWHTRWHADQRQPHSITVDMGKTNRIGGFTYLPRQDGLLNGVVENIGLKRPPTARIGRRTSP